METSPLLSRGSRVLRALLRPFLPRRSSLVASPRFPRILGFPAASFKMAGTGRQFATAPSLGGDSVARAPSSLAAENLDGGAGRFRLSPSSFLDIRKGDITVWSVDGSTDAIVNAANERMLGGGGVDGAIHRAAGPELVAACRAVPEVRPGVRCPTGEARISPAFLLPVSHVIHTVGPIYDADKQPEVSLRNAYRNSLSLAKENGIQYIAFPAISCGVYRYPYEEASKIAISAVKEFSDDFKESILMPFTSDVTGCHREPHLANPMAADHPLVLFPVQLHSMFPFVLVLNSENPARDLNLHCPFESWYRCRNDNGNKISAKFF